MTHKRLRDAKYRGLGAKATFYSTGVGMLMHHSFLLSILSSWSLSHGLLGEKRHREGSVLLKKHNEVLPAKP